MFVYEVINTVGWLLISYLLRVHYNTGFLINKPMLTTKLLFHNLPVYHL